MRRAAVRLDLEPHEALVRDREPQLGGLGDDRGVGACGLGDPLRADAVRFLVRDGGHDHVARELESRRAAAPTSMIAARLAFMS